MTGRYLYAVMAGEHRLDLDPCGVPDGSAEVVAIVGHGLTAVGSPYEDVPFSDLARADVFGRLVIHQRVIELVNDESSVLPARLGTVLSSEDEARMVLERFQKPLARALRDVGGAVEVDLSATWDTDAVIADVGREPAVAALAHAASTVQADDDLAERVRVGMVVHEAVQKRREEYRRRIVGDLLAFTRDAQPNPVLTDNVVVNLALLVERSMLTEFELAVDRLGEELANWLTFRYVGPLPPYSFATVDVLRPDSHTVESARRVLGLGEHCSAATLKSTYRRLAAEVHPDRNVNDPGAQERFALLTSARDTLNDFISGQPVDGPRSGSEYEHDLTPTSVEHSLLLRISRSDEPPSSLHQASNEPDLFN